MIKEKNKKITINDLAIMVANGFESVDTQLNTLRTDIFGMKSDLVTLHKFDELATRVTKLEKGKK